MDTMSALRMSRVNRGNPIMTFDWVKAATLIREEGAKTAIAGLQGDMEYTAGTIFADGKPVYDSYTYLASNWATPVLILDDEVDTGVEIPCFVINSEYDADTKWPPEALKVLKGEEDEQ